MLGLRFQLLFHRRHSLVLLGQWLVHNGHSRSPSPPRPVGPAHAIVGPLRPPCPAGPPQFHGPVGQVHWLAGPPRLVHASACPVHVVLVHGRVELKRN